MEGRNLSYPYFWKKYTDLIWKSLERELFAAPRKGKADEMQKKGKSKMKCKSKENEKSEAFKDNWSEFAPVGAVPPHFTPRIMKKSSI